MLKKSFAALVAVLSLAVPLQVAACAIFCVSSNCHGQLSAAFPDEPPCPHETRQTHLFSSSSVCNPAFTCVCSDEQLAGIRPVCRTQFVLTFSLQSVQDLSGSDARLIYSHTRFLPDPPITTSPSFLRI